MTDTPEEPRHPRVIQPFAFIDHHRPEVPSFTEYREREGVEPWREREETERAMSQHPSMRDDVPDPDELI